MIRTDAGVRYLSRVKARREGGPLNPVSAPSLFLLKSNQQADRILKQSSNLAKEHATFRPIGYPVVG